MRKFLSVLLAMAMVLSLTVTGFAIEDTATTREPEVMTEEATMAGKTVIMIAHRLSSVVDADSICVLKDGEITEKGTHKTLLEQNGLYAHMWEEYNKSVSWKVGKGEK